MGSAGGALGMGSAGGALGMGSAGGALGAGKVDDEREVALAMANREAAGLSVDEDATPCPCRSLENRFVLAVFLSSVAEKVMILTKTGDTNNNADQPNKSLGET